MNTTAANAKTTSSYECLFCGVRYDHVAEMRSCSICGHSVASGWLAKQSHNHAEQDRPAPVWREIYRAA